MTFEYAGNLHLHTPLSDGYSTHNAVARAALAAGLDFVVATDHNVYARGLDGYRYVGDKRVLLLVGEEVHDQTRNPQGNHLLIYDVSAELAPLAPNPQELINRVSAMGGLCFLAHPFEERAPLIGEEALDWFDWQVEGYTGLEIWNFMSEFKSLLKSVRSALFYAYNPELVAIVPPARALQRWDELLASGRRVLAIGGADAHALPVRFGPLKRVVFPYIFLFRAVNTHVLTTSPLTGETEADRRLLFDALNQGRSFVANDLSAPSRGFRFLAHGEKGSTTMGETVRLRYGVTFQIWIPQKAEVHLVHNGKIIRFWGSCQRATHVAREAGAYRVEAYLPFRGKLRGWIFSNPVFVVS